MEIKYMKEALSLALNAYNNGDIPVGCIIVKDNTIVGKGYNTRHITSQTVDHAEINAIKDANKVLGTWILEDCEMYVTLEPCQMCCGAIIQSRIKKVYFGAKDYKSGCIVSHLNMLDYDFFNHKVEYQGNILEEESSVLLKTFFKELRDSKKLKRCL